MSKEEYRPQLSKQPEQHKPQQEGGNGAPGLPPIFSHHVRQIYDVGYAERQERRARELDEKWVKKMQARGEVIPHSPDEIREKRLEARRHYLNTNREKVNESSRRRRKERAEQGLFPPSKQKPKQVFPEPIQE